MCCNLEVDVNGEHTFFLDKRILASYSDRVRKLLTKFARTQNPKLIFNDFPGGAESFELILTFCYNNGAIDITPSNVFFLHSSSTFMEIPTLIMQTELYLDSTRCWMWSEFINGLKQCQILHPSMNKSSCFQEFLNTLLGNLTLPSYLTSSCPSSSTSSSFRFSSSDISPKSSRSNTHQESWNLDDLSFLNLDLFEKLIKSMIFLHFDHPRICSFIFHYQKSKFFLCSTHDQKCKFSETSINLLSSLNCSAYSCRALLDAFGMSLSLNLRKAERLKLENFLGSRLDEFRINDLLVPGKKKGAYDVDLVLRLIKVFLLERRISGFFVHRVKKVGFLMDLFMLEVAPDPLLKASKFVALAMALPVISRESHDRIYHAVNLYLEVHQGLSEEQHTTVWSVLDINKLSKVTIRPSLARNTKCLPFVMQNQFKILLHNDFVVQKFSRRVRTKMENEKQGVNMHKFMLKKSRTLDPYNVKSLPRLCH